jgi:hypothetical protein
MKNTILVATHNKYNNDNIYFNVSKNIFYKKNTNEMNIYWLLFQIKRNYNINITYKKLCEYMFLYEKNKEIELPF